MKKEASRWGKPLLIPVNATSVLNQHSDCLQFLGKGVQAFFYFFDLLGPWPAASGGIMGQLFLIDSRDGLQAGKGQDALVIIQQGTSVELVRHFVRTVEHGGIRVSVLAGAIQVEINAFLHISLETAEILAARNRPSRQQVAHATIPIGRMACFHNYLFHAYVI